MGTITELFPKKPISESITVKVDVLEYWRIRNELISDEFHKYNSHEKQDILDTVLTMNYELYTLVVKLKERLGE